MMTTGLKVTLPETNSSPLKMDGWNTSWFPFGMAYFQGPLLLVSGWVLPCVAIFCIFCRPPVCESWRLLPCTCHLWILRQRHGGHLAIQLHVGPPSDMGCDRETSKGSESNLGGGFIFFYFHPYLAKIPILTLTSFFSQTGWNHQLVIKRPFMTNIHSTLGNIRAKIYV